MKPCNTCPFLKNSGNFGSIEWLEDVFRLVVKKQTDMHTCHKTDPNADGFVQGNGERMCDGIRMIAANEKLGFYFYKNVHKNFSDFFNSYAEKMKILAGKK